MLLSFHPVPSKFLNHLWQNGFHFRSVPATAFQVGFDLQDVLACTAFDTCRVSITFGSVPLVLENGDIFPQHIPQYTADAPSCKNNFDFVVSCSELDHMS